MTYHKIGRLPGTGLSNAGGAAKPTREPSGTGADAKGGWESRCAGALADVGWERTAPAAGAGADLGATCGAGPITWAVKRQPKPMTNVVINSKGRYLFKLPDLAQPVTANAVSHWVNPR
jgi:hypothetical protein